MTAHEPTSLTPTANTPDPSRALLHMRQADQRRALKSLEEMFVYQYEMIRWRFIRANAPPRARRLVKRADDKIADYTRALEARRDIVWAALGYDAASDDEPPPAMHWDKTALEED